MQRTRKTAMIICLQIGNLTTQISPGHTQHTKLDLDSGKNIQQPTTSNEIEAVGEYPLWFEDVCRSVVKHLSSIHEN